MCRQAGAGAFRPVGETLWLPPSELSPHTLAGRGLLTPCPPTLSQCQLGVLPLGTGNDLARVLGWGSACDDDTQLPQILEKLERASTKMLDR